MSLRVVPWIWGLFFSVCSVQSLNADIRRYAMDVEINEVFFSDDPIDSVLQTLWVYVENKHQNAPPLEISYPENADRAKRITLRITENSVFRALELAGRKAGFRVSFSPHSLILSSGPDRERNRTLLAEQLALRKLLIQAVLNPDPEVLSNLELTEFAEKQIKTTKVFRVGRNESGDIPIEYYALRFLQLKEMDNAGLLEVFIEASKVGQLYLAALHLELRAQLDLSTFPTLIPFLPEKGLIFQTAPTTRIYEDYIESGSLAQTIDTHLPYKSPAATPLP